MEDIIEEQTISTLVNTLPVQNNIAICYETAGDLDPSERVPPFAGQNPIGEDSSLLSSEEVIGPPTEYKTYKEKFQAEINKWEEFYDQIRKHLLNPVSPAPRNMPKTAANFSINHEDGHLYYAKVNKDGSVISVRVIRDYADRVRICRDIHLDTGDPSLHNRRDKMLELVGQMYHWKGQRRDVCQCVRITVTITAITTKIAITKIMQ